ncbi:hypothetical protein RSOL_108020 [Rhizoctonia solani AG-3 Rhs1AP]|uniref:Uncharacterized protein n=1 Tax=Rhizoctonia solani AG-3 Rhs1AP TaxID=1086054 RepID=X8J1Y7_9AGAM|nr:hypothetical protein RSOL_108020 [Rhizoctonia solani AG-3 Rhs1AP]
MQAIVSVIQFVLKWHMKKEKVQGSQETDTDSGSGSVSEGCDDSETSAGGFPTDVEKVGEIAEEGNAIQVSRPRWPNEMENKHVFIVLAGNGSRMWRGAFFVPSRDPALSFSPQPPPHSLVTMDSLSLLRESLPNAKLETAEREMSLDFKAAAQSLATLFKSSKQSVKHAHDAGYAACLQDMLQIIQSGVSEDSGVGVARVMDWAEGQLDRYREGHEFETVDEVMAGLPRRVTRDASRSPRRASSSTLPDLAVFDSTASKRRHAAMTSVETRRRSRVGPVSGERDIRTPRKVKRGGLGERERERERDRVADAMEFEDDAGRDRKRSKTVNGTPPS